MYLGLLGNTPLEKENWGRSYKKKITTINNSSPSDVCQAIFYAFSVH